MEKQSFGQLFGLAWRRSGDGCYRWLAIVNMLWTSLLVSPLLAIMFAVMIPAVRTEKTGEPFPIAMLLWAIPAAIVFALVAAWLSAAVNSGVMREALYPAPALVGRAFRNGFARWKTVFFPIPWILFASIVSSVTNNIVKGLDIETAIPLTALFAAVNIAVSIVTNFLYCGVAAEETSIDFSRLYGNAIRAFKNGWGRFVGYYFTVCGMALTVMLAALPGAICLSIGIRMGNDRLMLAGYMLLVVWVVFLCFALLKIYCFCLSFLMYLYADASGLSRNDGEGQEAEAAAEAAGPAEAEEAVGTAEATEAAKAADAPEPPRA